MGFKIGSVARVRVLAAGIIAALALLALPAAGVAKDRNHDRIPDRWEKRHNLSLKVNQAKRDQDSDGMRNRGEFRAGTNPRDADSDNDGTEDGAENAGTISSYTDGVLTISLYAGGEITGEVTDDTRVVCPPAEEEEEETPEDSAARFGGPGGPEGEDAGPRGEGGCGAQCSEEDLVEGTEVREADLRVTSGGTRFKVVKLG